MVDYYKEILGVEIEQGMPLESIKRALGKRSNILNNRDPVKNAEQLRLIAEALVVFDTEESRRAYDEALDASRREGLDEEEPAEDPRRQELEKLKETARSIFTSGDPELARNAVEKALAREDPDALDFELHELASRIYHATEDYDSALRHIDEVLLSDPDRIGLVMRKADILSDQVWNLGMDSRFQTDTRLQEQYKKRKEQMLTQLRRAERIAEKTGNTQAQAEALGMRAWYRYFWREDTPAEKLWDEAGSLAAKALSLGESEDAQKVLQKIQEDREAERQRQEAARKRQEEARKRQEEEKKRQEEERKRQEEEKKRQQEAARRRYEEQRAREAAQRAQREEEARKRAEAQRAQEEAQRQAEELRKRKARSRRLRRLGFFVVFIAALVHCIMPVSGSLTRLDMADYYRQGAEYYKEERYDAAMSNLQMVDKNSHYYKKAQALMKKCVEYYSEELLAQTETAAEEGNLLWAAVMLQEAANEELFAETSRIGEIEEARDAYAEEFRETRIEPLRQTVYEGNSPAVSEEVRELVNEVFQLNNGRYYPGALQNEVYDLYYACFGGYEAVWDCGSVWPAGGVYDIQFEAVDNTGVRRTMVYFNKERENEDDNRIAWDLYGGGNAGLPDYVRLSGTFFLTEEAGQKDKLKPAPYVRILRDNEEVFYAELQPGDAPETFDMDIWGASEIHFEFNGWTEAEGSAAGIADFTLYQMPVIEAAEP